jgi:uncharacterized membrane protein YoaK (UPF0700 family)
MAILFYFLGAFFTHHMTSLFKVLRRSTFAISFFLQAALIATAAGLVQGGIAPGILPSGAEYYIQLVPLPMLSFQAGQQSVASRQLGLNEIPTTVLTSVYCDLGNDANLFGPLNSNWPRNRRFTAVMAILLGAVIGGWLSRTSGGMSAPLWMAAGVKLCITVAWLVWKAEMKQPMTI